MSELDINQFGEYGFDPRPPYRIFCIDACDVYYWTVKGWGKEINALEYTAEKSFYLYSYLFSNNSFVKDKLLYVIDNINDIVLSEEEYKAIDSPRTIAQIKDENNKFRELHYLEMIEDEEDEEY